MSQQANEPNTLSANSSLDMGELTKQIEQSISAQDAAAIKTSRPIPPLEKWQPNLSGTMDMVVKANGEWWHEGSQITRQAMIDLFAKVLWSEVDDNHHVHYFLKTPVEKWRIQVEDAPLLINQVDVINQQIGDTTQPVLQFTTTQGDVVIADDAHPIRLGLPFVNSHSDNDMVNNAGENLPTLTQKQASQPYLLVRQNGDSTLYGLIHRNVFYHLIELGELVDREAGTSLILHSGDSTFTLTMTA